MQVVHIRLSVAIALSIEFTQEHFCDKSESAAGFLRETRQHHGSDPLPKQIAKYNQPCATAQSPIKMAEALFDWCLNARLGFAMLGCLDAEVSKRYSEGMFHAYPPKPHSQPRPLLRFGLAFKPGVLGNARWWVRSTYKSQFVFLMICCGTWSHAQDQSPTEAPIPIPIAQDGTTTAFMDAVEAHMDYVTENSHDQIGPRTTPMWLSTIDLRTNNLPDPLLPSSPRWRGILLSAPGANLYWDQPTILAAFELSKRSGCKCYSDAASAYITSFLTACSTSNQTSCIDARFYYDVRVEQTVNNTDTLASCIPYTPAWETIWAVDKKIARQQIQAFIQARTAKFSINKSVQRKKNATTGAPNLTIETEAALIASLCWLAQHDTHQQNLLIQQALSLAQLRIARRNRTTGLVPTGCNLPDQAQHTTLNTLGAWTNVLFWAASTTGETEFQKIAEQALHAWLTVGFDSQQQSYHQQLECKTGNPVKEFLPGTHPEDRPASNLRQISIFTQASRPAHQSPLRMAEACLSLHESTGDPISKQAIERWFTIINQQLPKDEMQCGYADDYGRAIHFLVRGGEVLKNPKYLTLARAIANEAMEKLYVPKMGMFRSHLGENRCDSADGPGLLLLALMYMEGDDPTLESCFQF